MPKHKTIRTVWTPEEDELIIKCYESGGLPACINAFPGRSYSSVQGHVHLLQKKGKLKYKINRWDANRRTAGLDEGSFVRRSVPHEDGTAEVTGPTSVFSLYNFNLKIQLTQVP